MHYLRHCRQPFQTVPTVIKKRHFQNVSAYVVLDIVIYREKLLLSSVIFHRKSLAGRVEKASK